MNRTLDPSWLIDEGPNPLIVNSDVTRCCVVDKSFDRNVERSSLNLM